MTDVIRGLLDIKLNQLHVALRHLHLRLHHHHARVIELLALRVRRYLVRRLGQLIMEILALIRGLAEVNTAHMMHGGGRKFDLVLSTV